MLLLIVILAFDLESCKSFKAQANQMQSSLKERETDMRLENTPAGMHSETDGIQIRRFMWPDIDETFDNLMEGVKQMIGSNAGIKSHVKVKSMHRFQPAASTKVKYFIKKPIKSNTISMTSNRPIKHSWPKSRPQLELKTFPENHEVFEQAAVREWQKEQNNSDAIETIPEQIIIGKFSSFNGWTPVENGRGAQSGPIKPAHSLDMLHTDVRPFVLSRQKYSSYDVTEQIGEKTVQSAQYHYKNSTKSQEPDFRIPDATDSPNYPEFFIRKLKTATPTAILPQKQKFAEQIKHSVAKDHAISSSSQKFTEVENSKTKQSNKVPTRKPQNKNQLRSLNLHNYKNSSKVLGRGTIKFGDRL